MIRAFYVVVFGPALSLFFFFFNDTATTEIYTLSLHDALPISLIAAATIVWFLKANWFPVVRDVIRQLPGGGEVRNQQDRKSTRLNSSHSQISYAVFCLKKKKSRSIDAGGGTSADSRSTGHTAD